VNHNELWKILKEIRIPVLLPAVHGGQDGGAQGSAPPAGRRGSGAAAWGWCTGTTQREGKKKKKSSHIKSTRPRLF